MDAVSGDSYNDAARVSGCSLGTSERVANAVRDLDLITDLKCEGVWLPFCQHSETTSSIICDWSWWQFDVLFGYRTNGNEDLALKIIKFFKLLDERVQKFVRAVNTIIGRCLP